MPVAGGGIQAANFVYNIAPKDGTVILGALWETIIAPVLDNPNSNFDTSKFNWIGSLNQEEAICGAWHTGRPFAAPPGIHPDRLSALHTTFDAGISDPEFIAVLAKARRPFSPVSGTDIQAAGQVFSVRAQLMSRLKDVSKYKGDSK